MDNQNLSLYTARQLEVEQVRRAYARGVTALALARRAVADLEAKQAARLAEIATQLQLTRTEMRMEAGA